MRALISIKIDGAHADRGRSGSKGEGAARARGVHPSIFISAAAAKVPGKSRADFFTRSDDRALCLPPVFIESHGFDNKPRRTEAALQGIERHECLLHGMQFPGPTPSTRCDSFACDKIGRKQTVHNRDTVEQDGAGSADIRATYQLFACETEIVKVTFSPHIAGTTVEANFQLARSAADQIFACLRGAIPTSPVNASAWEGPQSPCPAVLRLITNSNLTGAWTGSSLGFSPLRMRSTHGADRVTANVLSPGVAAAIPIKSRHGINPVEAQQRGYPLKEVAPGDGH